METRFASTYLPAMQLALGSDPRTETLRDIQNRLIGRFGRIIRPPAKRRDPVWALVQGVIGARTKTAASNASTDRLLHDYGSWEAVAHAPVGELAACLALQTFPELSAERLKACLTGIIDQRGAVDLSHLEGLQTDEAMRWLEALPGIARKVSAGVMNTSTFDRRALVIDTNHRRVVQRMGLVPHKADTARAYDALMPVMPGEWSAADIDEHHLLVKRLGQTSCRPSATDCVNCAVGPLCRTAIERGAVA